MRKEFIITDRTKLLVEGTNVLAVQVHNHNTNSSNLSYNCFLSFGIADASVFYNTPSSWFSSPSFPDLHLPLVVIDTDGASIPDEPKITGSKK